MTEPEATEVENHLLVCESCRDQLDAAAGFAAAIREELKRESEPRKTLGAGWFQWLTPRMMGALAFAILLIALAVYWRPSGPPLNSVAALQLTALRGEMQTAPLAREYDLTLKDPPEQAGAVRLEIVDGKGATVWNGAPATGADGFHVQLRRALKTDEYFVRLYGSDGELLHEYGFRVRP